MFSCCRCVNPKSPKYKKKVEVGDCSGSKDGCHDDNSSGEEEIKVEIIETDERRTESEATVKGSDGKEKVAAAGDDSSSSTKAASEDETTLQSQQVEDSHKTSPTKSTASSSERCQQSVTEAATQCFGMEDENASPKSIKNSSEKIPTTIAEVIETEKTTTTAIEENPSKVECRNNLEESVSKKEENLDADRNDCDPDLKNSPARELEHLIDRLERIVDRLERTVSARELEETRRILKDVCNAGKTICSGTTTNTEENTGTEEDEKLLDSNSNSDLPTVLPSTPPPSASYLHQQLDSLEATLFPELSSVEASVAAKDQPQPEVEQSQDTIPTVISQVVLDKSISSKNSNNQEPTSVLELTDHHPLPDNDFCGPIDATQTKVMSVNAYEDIVCGPLANFLGLSKKIGGDVAAQADLVKQAFEVQLSFVRTAAESSAPSTNDLQSLLKPTSDQIAAIQGYREKHRTSPYFNHLSAISESISALGWVCVAPTPGPYVKEMNDAGQFYTNRVLKDWKEKDTTHVEWARAWIQTLTELQQYIKQHHTTGLVWAGKNKPAAGGASVPPPPPPGGLPPPPPMMPMADLSIADAGDDRSALFAQINKGADITKGLKKVTSEMQTHKNPSLRSGPAPYKAPAGISNGTKSVTAPSATKPPSFVRDGKKWLIEYQKGNSNLVVEDAEMNNVVYMFRCENSTLSIKGKINSVVMDSCKKCSLVFDSLVASAEFVNCQSVQMQVLGKVPTISIDKTDGCQMYLSADSLNVEIVSSKSSEMNVMIPKGNSGDYTEQPIPEQFKTIIKGQSLNTTCVESLG
ncbi:adenylyl cyclase-associated protein 1 isoform X2 [Toxorhynchites rutilus septentrionalis]|uniref:adenylyl cyclase-associated protein 1 isoform X2 n=1 Tax=Toxorhynchites rutilus septentrionalis TaxID=329112 RepID=UPI00247AF468|nr:adenylyl cyclase-associated protein 1 isoform X2 [Toxorhynchites rutilus septentrionalis]